MIGEANFDPPFTDRTAVSHDLANEIKHNWVKISKEDVGMMKVPNSPENMLCCAWLENHFILIGDDMPNGGEIHLDSQDKKDIYNDYVSDIKNIFLEDSPVSFPQFWKLWHAVFPYVVIREYKGVTGKCLTCTRLTALKRQFHDPVIRQRIKELFAIHKITFMGEG